MKKFYHGGHIGDVIYALYTVKKCGGGLIELGPGQTCRWGDKEIDSLIPLINYQPHMQAIKKSGPSNNSFNFLDCVSGCNPDIHFELHGQRWPGNANLKKRYFIGYYLDKKGMAWCLDEFIEEKWIKAPKTKSVDIVMHLPVHRLCRPITDWIKIIDELKKKYSIVIIGGDDINEWMHTGLCIKPTDMLEAADWINSAKIFAGSASCNYVLAEGLRKIRFVDIPQESEGTIPGDHTGWNIADWNIEKVIKNIHTCM